VDLLILTKNTRVILKAPTSKNAEKNYTAAKLLKIS
jgi:hypothetical protein